MRVAISGFGRIGRMVFKANLANPKIDIVAINDCSDPQQTAHLLKYDSNYGVAPQDIRVEDGQLKVDDQSFTLVCNRDPEQLPWKELNIDVVIECTGVFRDREGAGKHIKAGAKRVVISAPGKDVDRTIVYGVNHEDYNPETDFILSNASCTTNCLAPVVKVVNDAFGIENGLLTTIHAYTGDQNIHDNKHKKDLRRARGAFQSMIPTSTGAAKAIAEVMPEMKGRLDGMAVRVPTPTVSLVDLTVELGKATNGDELNAALKAAAEGPLKGVLDYSDLPLVSIDYTGNENSSIIDALSTKVDATGKMAKVLSWYDNEWGYSCRCLDIVAHMSKFE